MDGWMDQQIQRIQVGIMSLQTANHNLQVSEKHYTETRGGSQTQVGPGSRPNHSDEEKRIVIARLVPVRKWEHHCITVRLSRHRHEENQSRNRKRMSKKHLKAASLSCSWRLVFLWRVKIKRGRRGVIPDKIRLGVQLRVAGSRLSSI